MNTPISTKLFATLALAGLMVAPLSLLANEPPTNAKPYLGVALESKTAPDQTGVTLGNVSAEGPAGKAGLKSGDRIVKVGENEVKTIPEFMKVLGSHKPGDKLVVKAIRDGKEQSFTVTLGEMPVQLGAFPPNAANMKAFLGVFTQELTAELKDRLGVDVDKGAVVARVMPESPAAAAGLQDHDVITQVGTVVVTTPAELREAIQNAGAGTEVVLKVARGEKSMEIKVKLQESAAGAEPPLLLPGLPKRVEEFSGKLPAFFEDMNKVPALEKKVQELENRIKELEKKLNK